MTLSQPERRQRVLESLPHHPGDPSDQDGCVRRQRVPEVANYDSGCGHRAIILCKGRIV
jgi:hypothetical protein